MDLSRDALRHSGRMWRHTEDSGGGVMRFVCSLDRLQVVATRKAAEFGSPCPRRSQRPCSISSALLSAGVLSKLRPLVSFRLYLLPLVVNVEKYRRKLVDLDLINFRFWIRLGARWRSWVFGWKGDLCFRFDSRKQWKKEIHLSSIVESYLNLRIMRSKERRRIY